MTWRTTKGVDGGGGGVFCQKAFVDKITDWLEDKSCFGVSFMILSFVSHQSPLPKMVYCC